MCTFADITEPDVLKSAITLAVNSLKSVRSDNNVAQSSTILKDEDSVGRSSVIIRVARMTTIELLVSEVLNSRDHAWCREGNDATGSCWDVEGLRGSKGGEDNCDSGDLELHFENKIWRMYLWLKVGLRCNTDAVDVEARECTKSDSEERSQVQT